MYMRPQQHSFSGLFVYELSPLDIRLGGDMASGFINALWREMTTEWGVTAPVCMQKCSNASLKSGMYGLTCFIRSACGVHSAFL